MIPDSPIPVNIAVCGRFHLHKWYRYLDPEIISPLLYYSHRVGEHPFAPHPARNLPAKEYLTHLHMRLLGELLLPQALPLYHDLWARSVLSNWRPAKVAHVLLHGSALPILERCRRDGTYIVGEAVNAHIRVANDLLAEEHARLGLRFKTHKVWNRLEDEYEMCDLILTPSDWVARSFIEAGFSKDRIAKISYPSSTAATLLPQTTRPTNSREIRILCVGSLQVRKGQHILLDSIRLLNLQGERATLTLVGGVPDQSYLDVLRRSSITFEHIPHIPNDRMLAFMAGFDVVALPSFEDGFGIVIAEALQAGVPVVTTRNAGAADAIEDGNNGFVVPAGDQSALAEAIHKASTLQMPHKFTVKGQSNDWQDYSKRLTDAYLRFVAGCDS